MATLEDQDPISMLDNTWSRGSKLLRAEAMDDLGSDRLYKRRSTSNSPEIVLLRVGDTGDLYRVNSGRW